MALKVWDGFDHYNNTNDFVARSGFLQYNSSGVNFTTGSDGVGEAVSLQNQSFEAVWAARNAEFFVGHRLKPQSDGTLGAFLITLEDTVANLPQVTIAFSYSGYWIAIYRGGLSGGTLLYLSPNNVFADNTWQFVEVHGKIDGSAGEVEVRINGVTKATISGVNTQNTSNAWSDGYGFSVGANNGALYVDDLYYCDTTTGSGIVAANTFLGDCRTVTLFAIGNDSVQWAPLANTNWQEVAEVAMDGDASYNFSDTVGQQDLLNFGALPATTTFIFGIELTGAYRKDDSGSRTVEQVLKSGGTTVDGPAYPLPETYVYFTDQWILDPNTGLNWTTAAVDALNGGYKVSS